MKVEIVLASFLIYLARALSQCDYDIEIKTKCGTIFEGTGTDGNVEVSIWDAWAPLFNQPAGSFVFSGNLDNPGNDFERCSTDRYKITNKRCINFCSLGLTLSIEAGFAEIGAAWRPEYVKVSGNGTTRSFPIDRYLNPNRPLSGNGNFDSERVNQCTF